MSSHRLGFRIPTTAIGILSPPRTALGQQLRPKHNPTVLTSPPSEARMKTTGSSRRSEESPDGSDSTNARTAPNRAADGFGQMASPSHTFTGLPVSLTTL